MKLYSYSGLLEEGRLWIPLKDSNALYCFEKDYKGSFVGFLSGSKEKKCVEIWWIISYNNYLFLFSRNSYELWKVDKDSKEIEYFRYLNEEVDSISNVEMFDGIAWVLDGSFNGSIIRIDLDSLAAEKKNYFSKMENDYCPVTPTKLINGKMYFASRSECDICIYVFDCLNEKINCCPITDARFVNCVDVDEDSIWVLYLSKGNKVILFRKSIIDNSKEEFDLSGEIKLSDSIRMDFLRLIRKENELLFIPFFNDNIVRLSLSTTKIIGAAPSENRDYIVYSYTQVCRDFVLLFSPSIGKMQRYYFKQNELEDINLNMPFEESSRYYRAFIEANPIIIENEGFTLASYVENI